MKNNILILFLFGCDKIVKEETFNTYTEERQVSCTKFSYCFTCMHGIDIQMQCGFKASAFCPGHQTALVEVTRGIVIHESGKIKKFERTRELELRGSCI